MQKNTPSLRFPKFRNEWQENRLGNIVDYKNGGSFEDYVVENEKYKLITLNSIDINGDLKTNHKTVKFADWYLEKDDLIMVLSDVAHGNFLGLVDIIPEDKKYVLNQRMGLLRKKDEQVNLKFLRQYINNNQRYFKLKGQGPSQQNLSKGDILKFKLLLPNLLEQQKIAEFLTQADSWLQNIKKQKELYEDYQKGMMQKIFSQEIRFKDGDGKEFPNWKSRKLDEVFLEHKQKSTGKEEVFSVSVHKSLINQIEHLGRSFAAKNTENYNLVKPFDIVYTKSPTGDFPLGIIKQSRISKNVIVSPLYGVFTPETPGLGYMLHVYFESPINTQNYLNSIVLKGAKNTINITNKTFLSKSLVLPISKEEQQKIAEFLASLDKVIESKQKQIGLAESWKKGLMQRMFV